ncbi:MAG TPA: DUF3050 domain-containing protein [Bryobacteraceae bacterium]|nr:DUF3050 domain-containing protein [Bryobacteraceae bacterium]
MNQTVPDSSIRYIEARIAPFRSRLAAHPLYSRVTTRSQIQIFMELHVFAVWDFMSLLKALQAQLTCVRIPWVPTRWPDSRRFINEIVLGEESDTYAGRSISHFELYLEAMEECGADTAPIRSLLSRVAAAPGSTPIASLLETAAAPAAARRFVETTFGVIASGNLSAMASAFTFGREDLIPGIFRKLVRDLNSQSGGALEKFIWYLERHIEVDGEEHGPLSLRMVADLCGTDERLWEQAAHAAESALSARLALWDGILEQLETGN